MQTSPYPGRAKDTMKVGTWHRFVVSARAIAQGTRWTGAYKIRQTDESLVVTVPFQDTVQIDETFETREEAENFAFAEGLEAAKTLPKV